MGDALSRAALVAAAKDLNEILGVDPPIDVESDRATLKAKVREAVGLLEKTDKPSEKTLEVIDALKAEGGDEPAADDKKGKDDESDAKPASKSKSGGKAAKSDSKPAAKSKSSDGKKKEPKAPKAPKEPRYTKNEALKEALKKGGTREELAVRVEELYVKQNPTKANAKGSQIHVDLTLPTLMLFGAVTKTGDKYKLA